MVYADAKEQMEYLYQMLHWAEEMSCPTANIPSARYEELKEALEVAIKVLGDREENEK